MNINKINHEKFLILGLLILTLFFIFWIIPNSIEDPENFGIKDGLPPSFSAYLVGFLTFFTLLFQYITGVILIKNDDIKNDILFFSREVFKRSFKIILVCLLYSFIFIENLGFYLGSFIFVIILSFLLGEKRFFILCLFPTLLILFVYFGFKVGFSIFLPEGKILEQIFESVLVN